MARGTRVAASNETGNCGVSSLKFKDQGRALGMKTEFNEMNTLPPVLYAFLLLQTPMIPSSFRIPHTTIEHSHATSILTDHPAEFPSSSTYLGFSPYDAEQHHPNRAGAFHS